MAGESVPICSPRLREWTQPPHLAGSTGLSRYFDIGDGPVPEIMGDPSHYYRGVAQFFESHGSEYEKYVIPADSGDSLNPAAGPVYDVSNCGSEPKSDPSSRQA